MSRSLVAISLCVAGLAGFGCTYNPATGRNQLLLLTTEEEIALGDEAKPQLTAEYGGELRTPPVRDAVTRVGRHLAGFTEADYQKLPWEFTVLDSDVVNAFALPGGKVFISRGLLVRLHDEAEMAGVLGHEIGHVTSQHIDERISQAILLEFGVALTGTLTQSQIASYGASIVSGGYQLKFSRDQESEADRQGVKYMAAAGYAPQAMIGLLEVLMEASQSSRPPEFLSTHPYPESRIRTIHKLLDGPYKITVDNPDFGRFPDRYDREVLSNLGPAMTRSGDAAGPAWCGICRHGGDFGLGRRDGAGL